MNFIKTSCVGSFANLKTVDRQKKSDKKQEIADAISRFISCSKSCVNHPVANVAVVLPNGDAEGTNLKFF